MYRRNLKKLFDKAIDTDTVDGLDWYKKARVFCKRVAVEHNVEFIKVCGVLAALSPRNRWERNKLDTVNLIKYLTGQVSERPLFGTYDAMVDKATQIFNGFGEHDRVKRTLKGPKISAFFDNIFSARSKEVTVDTWMLLAAMGKYMSVDERPALTKKSYTEIAAAIKDLAAKVELKPYELQAIVWCVIKRINSPALQDQK